MNLYVVIVGQTSSGRKGTARAQVERQIRLADPEFARNNLVSGLASGEGLIHSVRDKIEKTVPLKIKGRFTGEYETYIDDHGVDDKRLCVFESEFSRLLKSAAREGNILSEILRLAWDGHDLRTIVKNFPETATAPHISLVAHVTKDELHTCFETVEYSNGFGNRFLWVASARNKLLPFTPDISDELLEPVAGHLRLARDFWSGNTEQSQFSADARDRWITVYPSLTADRDGLAGGLLARAEAQVLRLALLYSALDCSREIHVEHLNAALACWEYCENSTRAIFGDAIGRPAADRILEALRTDAHGLTRTQISSLFGRNLMATTIVDAINELESAGKARCTKMQGPNGGRPTETWFAADKS